MKAWLIKNWGIILFWSFLVLLRLALTFSPPHIDLLAQSEWGKWMYVNDGVKGLYQHNVWGGIWPNHPPLISYLYFESYRIHSFLMGLMSNLGNFIALNRLAPTKFIWFFNFIRWFGQAKYGTSGYLLGVMVVIKQIMVLADLAVAGIIYKTCKKNNCNWKKYVLAYLLLPFSWYLSAVWGQSNQLSFVFLIISFILLSGKRSIWSPLLYAIAINLKPDCVFLVPLYLVIWVKQKQPWRNLFLGGLLAGVFSLWTLTWFDQGNLIGLLKLLSKRLNTSEGLVNLNAFNFWYVLFPFPSKVLFETTKWFGITVKLWGYICWGVINILSFKLIKYRKLESIFLTMFTVGFGSWLFMTGMHERYAFYSLAALLFYSIYKKKYFNYFVVLSVIFFWGMFYVFSVPQSLDGIKVIFGWGGQIVPRVLSLINIFVYLKIFRREYVG